MTEVAKSTRSFIYSDIALLHFFERSGITRIYVADNIRTVWTRSRSAIKIFSEWDLLAIKYIIQNCVHIYIYIYVEKIYK